MTDETPEAIETEPCTVVLLNGQTLNLMIRKGSWYGYLKEMKADGGIFTDGWAVPLTSIAALIRGPIMPREAIDVSGRGRLN